MLSFMVLKPKLRREPFIGNRFELLLGWLAIPEKNWAVKYATFEGVFICLHGQKKNTSAQ